LKVKTKIDKRIYEKGKKVPKELFEAINLKPCDFHPEWNYTIQPNSSILNII